MGTNEVIVKAKNKAATVAASVLWGNLSGIQ
jgi:hypothetical protein